MLLEALKLLSEMLVFVSYVSGSQSFPPPLSAEEEKDCIAKLAEGDERARSMLIERNLRLVAHIAKKYGGGGREMDDMISIGAIGLIKAVNTYDGKKGKALSAYAARCIENEILMAIRAEKKRRGDVPMNEAIGIDKDGNHILLHEVIGTEDALVPEEAEYNLNVKKLYRAIETKLSARERTIMELRYGLLSGQCKTQREIAALLGISRSYISRIEKKAVEKLRTVFEK